VKQSLIHWVERYFYAPGPLEKLLSFLFSPLSLLYCYVMQLRFNRSRVKDFGIKVISVGNLTVGGSGKTPLVTALASVREKPAVVLRGYGRQSQGLIVVSDADKILCDVHQSGDEAMIYAQKLPHAVVIVSEKRDLAIEKAKEMDCNVVFLDDGYSKHHIKKLDLVIDVPTINNFCLPSGPYRERLWSGKEAIVLKEGKDFKRQTTLIDPHEKMLLVTAIARPERLDDYLPEVVGKVYFPDHYYFTEAELNQLLETSSADSLLVTYKDYVKIRHFNLPISLLDLDLEIDQIVMETVDNYINVPIKEKHDPKT